MQSIGRLRLFLAANWKAVLLVLAVVFSVVSLVSVFAFERTDLRVIALAGNERVDNIELSLYKDGAKVSSVVLKQGVATFNGIPKGIYKLRAIADGQVLEQEVDLSASSSARLDFSSVLEFEKRLSIKVVDGKNSPVENAIIGLNFKDFSAENYSNSEGLAQISLKYRASDKENLVFSIRKDGFDSKVFSAALKDSIQVRIFRKVESNKASDLSTPEEASEPFLISEPLRASGKLQVSIKGFETRDVQPTVEVFDGDILIQSLKAVGGVALFSLPIGSFVKVSSHSFGFKSQSVGNVEVRDLTRLGMVLEELNDANSFSLKILSRDSNNNALRSKIWIYADGQALTHESGIQLLGSTIVSIPKQYSSLNIYGIAEGKLPLEVQVPSSGGEVVIAFDDATPDNSATLNLSIKYDDGMVAEAAIVKVSKPDGSFVIPSTLERSFALKRNEEYVVSAVSNGASLEERVFLQESKSVSLILKSDFGTLNLNALDADLKVPVSALAYSFFKGKIFDSCITPCGLKVKTGFPAAIKVSSQNYFDLVFQEHGLAKFESRDRAVSIVSKGSVEDVLLKLERVSDCYGKTVSHLENAREYCAEFLFAAKKFPAGFFIRLDSKDGNFINNILNVPSLEDNELLFSDDAASCALNEAALQFKWVEMRFKKPFDSSISFKVKFATASLPSETELDLNYRSYSIRDGSWLRVPEDKQLGFNESISTKENCKAESFLQRLPLKKNPSLKCNSVACIQASVDKSKVGITEAVTATISVKSFDPPVRFKASTGPGVDVAAKLSSMEKVQFPDAFDIQSKFFEEIYRVSTKTRGKYSIDFELVGKDPLKQSVQFEVFDCPQNQVYCSFASKCATSCEAECAKQGKQLCSDGSCKQACSAIEFKEDTQIPSKVGDAVTVSCSSNSVCSPETQFQCIDNACQKCGGLGESCCAASQCNAGSQCNRNVCSNPTHCGQLFNVCVGSTVCCESNGFSCKLREECKALNGVERSCSYYGASNFCRVAKNADGSTSSEVVMCDNEACPASNVNSRSFGLASSSIKPVKISKDFTNLVRISYNEAQKKFSVVNEKSEPLKEIVLQVDNILPADAVPVEIIQPPNSQVCTIDWTFYPIRSTTGAHSCYSFNGNRLFFNAMAKGCPFSPTAEGSLIQDDSASLTLACRPFGTEKIEIPIKVKSSSVQSFFVTPENFGSGDASKLLFAINNRQLQPIKLKVSTRGAISNEASYELQPSSTRAFAWRGPGEIEFKEDAASQVAFVAAFKEPVKLWREAMGTLSPRVNKCDDGDYLCCANNFCTGSATKTAKLSLKKKAKEVGESTVFRRGGNEPLKSLSSEFNFEGKFSFSTVGQIIEGVIPEGNVKKLTDSEKTAFDFCLSNGPKVMQWVVEASSDSDLSNPDSMQLVEKVMALQKQDYVDGEGVCKEGFEASASVVSRVFEELKKAVEAISAASKDGKVSSFQTAPLLDYISKIKSKLTENAKAQIQIIEDELKKSDKIAIDYDGKRTDPIDLKKIEDLMENLKSQKIEQAPTSAEFKSNDKMFLCDFLFAKGYCIAKDVKPNAFTYDQASFVTLNIKTCAFQPQAQIVSLGAQGICVAAEAVCQSGCFTADVACVAVCAGTVGAGCATLPACVACHDGCVAAYNACISNNLILPSPRLRVAKLSSVVKLDEESSKSAAVRIFSGLTAGFNPANWASGDVLGVGVKDGKVGYDAGAFTDCNGVFAFAGDAISGKLGKDLEEFSKNPALALASIGLQGLQVAVKYNPPAEFGIRSPEEIGEYFASMIPFVGANGDSMCRTLLPFGSLPKTSYAFKAKGRQIDVMLNVGVLPGPFCPPNFVPKTSLESVASQNFGNIIAAIATGGNDIGFDISDNAENVAEEADARRTTSSGTDISNKGDVIPSTSSDIS